MSFSQKLLTAQISLASGSFGGGGNSLSISGLRMSAKIRCTPSDGQSFLDSLAIYGMPLSQMNQLSTVGTQYGNIAKNTILVQAGDADAGMSTVFQGDILSAFVDAQSQPDVCFRVVGKPGLYNAVKPIPPTSVQGTADVATIVGKLAQTMGYQFEGNGVSVKIANPYLHGTGISQVKRIINAAGLQWLIDPTTNTLAIWQPGQGRQGSTPLVSPQTGMVGYPAFQQSSLLVRMLYTPAIKCGQTIQVQSSLTPACGKWLINQLDYDLESLVPRGKWFMDGVCTIAQQPTLSGAQ